MSFADTAVLFILALLLFGPKKLPQIARQVGKALAEFKRASNEFKAQIEAEISQLEIEEKRKEREQEQKSLPNPQPVAEAVQSSRFGPGSTSELVAPQPELTQAETQNDVSAPPQDENSPAHSTHA